MNTPLPKKYRCPKCPDESRLQYFTKKEAGGCFKVWFACTNCSWETHSFVGDYANGDTPTKLAKEKAKKIAKIKT